MSKCQAERFGRAEYLDLDCRFELPFLKFSIIPLGNVGVPIKLLFEAEGMKITVEVSPKEEKFWYLPAVSRVAGYFFSIVNIHR